MNLERTIPKKLINILLEVNKVMDILYEYEH